MLYHLFFRFASEFSPFNVFRYITFRTGAATLTALFIAFMVGPPLIRWLERMRVGQPIRDIGPDHQSKEGTPTMGGLLILLSLLVSVLLWSNLDNRFVWIVIGITSGYGLLGFIDDYRKVKEGHHGGISARAKLFWQTLMAFGVALAIYNHPDFDAHLAVPFFKNFTPYLGIFYVPFAAFVIVATSNSVNLTDGLDGLAIGCSNSAVVAYLFLTYVVGNYRFANYLQVPFVLGTGELTVFCGALLGAGLGFLWYNCHPAKIFMGDTGSLAIGGAIAMLAILTKQELLLIIVGGVFVIEAASVVIQSSYFKYSKKRFGKGRRIFKCAPLHHHFEFLEKERALEEKRPPELVETVIVTRFWILSIIFALIGVATLKIR